MKIREQLLIGLLVATAGYAAWMTYSENRLRTDLGALQATHQQLQEKHRKIKESYIQFAANPRPVPEPFCRVIELLEAEGADIITPSGPSATRINEPLGIQIK